MTEPANVSSRARGCGCWRSCLIGSVALLLITAMGLTVAYYLGRPILERQTLDIRESYPWLDPLWDLVTGPSAVEAPVGSASSNLERQPGVSDKTALPEDIPVFPNAEQEGFSISNTQVTLFQSISRPSNVVLAYFDEEMRARGWSRADPFGASVEGLSIWRKQERGVCRLETGEYDNLTRVTLLCSLGND